MVIAVPEEVALGYGLVLLVEELEGRLVRKLNDWMLQRANLLEHLVRNLRVQVYVAVLELVEGRVEGPVDVQKFFTKPFKLGLVARLAFHYVVQLGRELVKIILSSLYIFLSLHQENVLLLVMSRN